MKFFKPVNEHVNIHQKTVRHTPLQKLYDAFIAILAGAHGMVEVNKRLRNDPGLQPPLDARIVLNSRECSARWMRALLRMWRRCKQR
jgi:hypothetical protein